MTRSTIPDRFTPAAAQKYWNETFFELVGRGFALRGGESEPDEAVSPPGVESPPKRARRKARKKSRGRVTASVTAQPASNPPTPSSATTSSAEDADNSGDVLDWPNPAVEMAAVARGFWIAKRHLGNPVLYRPVLGWYIYDGRRYEQHTDEEFDKKLYHFFGPLSFGVYDKSLKETRQVKFNPDGTFLKRCRESVRPQVLRSNLVHNTWLDGRKNRTVALRNGLLDLDSGIFTNSHDPLFFNTATLPFDYDAGALAPRWVQFLDEVWPGDIDAHALLQEWLGYLLSGRTDLQKMLLVMGLPGTGKGVLSKVLENLVGECNFASVNAEILTGRFGLATLADKQLGIFYDASVLTSGKAFTERLKTITGGDAVVLEKKNKDAYTGRLPTRFTFFTNDVPTLPDASSAILTRILSLYTGVVWRGAEGMNTHLFEEELAPELPGIFNWALDGLDRLEDNGGCFTHAHSADRVREELRAGTSPLQQFVEAECVVAPGLAVAKQDLYREWKIWADDNGHHSGSSGDFGKKLFAAYGTAISDGKVGGRGDQRAAYRGIELQPKEFQDGVRRVG